MSRVALVTGSNRGIGLEVVRGAVVGIVDLALLHEPGVALAVPIEQAVRRFTHSDTTVAQAGGCAFGACAR